MLTLSRKVTSVSPCPWDDVFHEFHITQCGWTFIEQKVDGNAALAAAVVQAEAHAEMHVTKWREVSRCR